MIDTLISIMCGGNNENKRGQILVLLADEGLTASCAVMNWSQVLVDEIRRATNGTTRWAMNVSQRRYRRPWGETGSARQAWTATQGCRTRIQPSVSHITGNRGLSLFCPLNRM